MGAIVFDWDFANERHLARHRVAPAEFEELILGEPLYLEYQVKGNEERYKVLGKTKAGRPYLPKTFTGRVVNEKEARHACV